MKRIAFLLTKYQQQIFFEANIKTFIKVTHASKAASIATLRNK
jgi:hypothetical protein